MRRIHSILFAVFLVLCISSYSVRNTQTNNISTWWLSYNDKELASSRTILPIDTSAIIKLDPGYFKNGDSIRFFWFFDHFGGIKYNTQLFLTKQDGTKVLVSEKTTTDHCEGKFAAMRMKQVADSFKCKIL